MARVRAQGPRGEEIEKPRMGDGCSGGNGSGCTALALGGNGGALGERARDRVLRM